MPKRDKFITGYSRRAFVLGAFKLSMFGILVGRAYQLQVTDHKKYISKANSNRIKKVPILPARGFIYDRNGEPLAVNAKSYELIYNPEDADNPIEELKSVATTLGVEISIEEVLAQKPRSNKTKSITVKEGMEWGEVAKFEVNFEKHPNAHIIEYDRRFYIGGESFSHILGYVKKPSKIEDNAPQIKHHPSYRQGAGGLEKQLEKRLFGRVGLKNVEVDSRGRHIRDLDSKPSFRGDSISLTLDKGLQELAMKELSNKGGKVDEAGAAVVLDIRTGEVLAMASVPEYDNNLFIGGISHENYGNYRENKDSPFTFRPTMSTYPPGSTFKIITALAALDAGIINKNTVFECTGEHEFGDRVYHCWNQYGHGVVDLIEAIAQSCNVYFYELAERVGIDRIEAMAKKFGVGTKTGIEMPIERSGQMPGRDWKRKTFKQGWFQGETLNAAIGQGYTLTTPLQMAVMTGSVANGGYLVKPTLIKGYNLDDEYGNFVPIDLEARNKQKIDVSRSAIKVVQEGMKAVVNNPIGTMYNHRIEDYRYAFAGKSGTAQVKKRRDKGKMYNERKFRYHATMVGFAPYVDPKYAVAVVVEHGGFGALTAGPIGKKLLEYCQKELS